jgi:siroheme synthase-like protein
MTAYYPIYLQLQDQACVVIGGGKVAEGKVESLLAAGAAVTLISPDLSPHLQELVDGHAITHLARCYRPGDLTGAFVVISATDQADVNHQVWEEASAHGQLVNVVDDTPHCNFIAPAIVRKGDLTIAISTGGKAPALAVRFREHLQRGIGPEYERFLELAGQLREPLAQHVPDFQTRKALWYDLVDSDALDLLAQGDEPAALEVISAVIGFRFEPAY